MELTNLVFAGLLIVMIFGGMAIFFSDVQSNYPIAAGTNPGMATAYSNLNASVAPLNNLTNSAQTAAIATNTQDQGVAAALGYLFGAISSLQILVQMPPIILNFINVLFTMGGAYMPAFVLPLITIAVTMLVIIGILYYLMKVK